MRAAVYFVTLSKEQRDTLNLGGWSCPIGVAYMAARDGDYSTADARALLRIAAVALFVLIFVFWSRPTGLVVLVLAILLLVVLGLIELIGRPSAQAEPVGPAVVPEGLNLPSASKDSGT